MTRDARGIDLVVGAKGSPMQIILAGIYQLTRRPAISRSPRRGSCAESAGQESDAARDGRQLPRVPHRRREARVPRATTAASSPPAGCGEEPLEAVLGAEVARAHRRRVSAVSSSACTARAKAARSTASFPIRWSACWRLPATVLDRLVLDPDRERVAGARPPGKARGSEEATRGQLREDGQEVTALLIQYASPLAAATLPRADQLASALQAASPAYERARLFRMSASASRCCARSRWCSSGRGGLSVFIALYTAMEERRYDLAVMRTLGASPGKLFGCCCSRPLSLALAGAAIGVALGHLARRAARRCWRPSSSSRSPARRGSPPSSGSSPSRSASASSPRSCRPGAPTAPTSRTTLRKADRLHRRAGDAYETFSIRRFVIFAMFCLPALAQDKADPTVARARIKRDIADHRAAGAGPRERREMPRSRRKSVEGVPRPTRRRTAKALASAKYCGMRHSH